MIRRAQPRPEQEGVEDALVAEDDLPGEDTQEVAREERCDQEQEKHVLPLRPGQRQIVRQRVCEDDDDRRDDQRHLHRLPEEPEVDGAVQEVVPGLERERMRSWVERQRIHAVGRDDRDRGDEEHRKPRERQTEQARGRQVEPAPLSPAANCGRLCVDSHYETVLSFTDPAASAERVPRKRVAFSAA